MSPVIGTNICHLDCCQCIAIGAVCPFGSQNHCRHNQDSSNECPCLRNTCAFSKNTENKILIRTKALDWLLGTVLEVRLDPKILN